MQLSHSVMGVFDWGFDWVFDWVFELAVEIAEAEGEREALAVVKLCQ